MFENAVVSSLTTKACFPRSILFTIFCPRLEATSVSVSATPTDMASKKVGGDGEKAKSRSILEQAAVSCQVFVPASHRTKAKGQDCAMNNSSYY